MNAKKVGLYIILIGSVISILFPPYTFRGHEGYNLIFGKVKEIGFLVSRETSVFNIIDYKTLIFQLLIIITIGLFFYYGTPAKTKPIKNIEDDFCEVKKTISIEENLSKKKSSALDIDI